MPRKTLDLQIAGVVQAGNCSGCGACCLLDQGLEMQLNEHGYARPVRTAPSASGTIQAPFERVCPGVMVQAARPDGATRHPEMGSALQSWQAWATDPEIRYLGSSGGVITALLSWLVRTQRVTEVIAATKSERDPRRTVTVSLRTPTGVIEAAGSRYAPVSNAARAALGRSDVAFVGKPCEVAALRALAHETGLEAPLLIAFFCAGTPSQSATDALVERLSEGQAVTDLWYRGHGWPGNFTVTTKDGATAGVTYDKSWGEELGPTMQWRCKICPDGVGESADLVAADYWESDENGYPTFDEGDGVSALLARTPRGLNLLREALAEGAIAGEDLDLGSLAKVQPLQVDRRQTLLARLVGARLAGRPVPSYRGFDLVALSPRNPLRLLRIVRGTFQRVRAGRAKG